MKTSLAAAFQPRQAPSHTRHPNPGEQNAKLTTSSQAAANQSACLSSRPGPARLLPASGCVTVPRKGASFPVKIRLSVALAGSGIAPFSSWLFLTSPRLLGHIAGRKAFGFRQDREVPETHVCKPGAFFIVMRAPDTKNAHLHLPGKPAPQLVCINAFGYSGTASLFL